MRILVTGKNGQIGFELQRSLAPLGDVVAVGRGDCDLCDVGAIRELVRLVAPDVIVNSAAYTAVDKAEAEPAVAQSINAVAPGVIGEEAARLGVPVVHYSTDYVFDGVKSASYRESDAPNPLNVYGFTKLAGERALAESNPRHLILRTSWVVGAHGANFAKTMLRLSAERDQLAVVADQYGAPTSASLLADITALLIHRHKWQGQGFPYGTYHVTASGETNWCDYARFVVERALASGKRLKVTPESIRPIASADYKAAAKRPANSRMDTTRFRETFGLRLPPWQEGVGHILEQIL